MKLFTGPTGWETADPTTKALVALKMRGGNWRESAQVKGYLAAKFEEWSETRRILRELREGGQPLIAERFEMGMREWAHEKKTGYRGDSSRDPVKKPFAVMFNMSGDYKRHAMMYVGKKPSRKSASFKTFAQAWQVAMSLSRKHKAPYYFITHSGSPRGSWVKAIVHRGKGKRIETKESKRRGEAGLAWAKSKKHPLPRKRPKRPAEPLLKPGQRLWRIVSLTGSGFTPGMPRERGLIVAKDRREAQRIANKKHGSRGTLVYLFKTYRQQQLNRGREGRWFDPNTLRMHARRPAKNRKS